MQFAVSTTQYIQLQDNFSSKTELCVIRLCVIEIAFLASCYIICWKLSLWIFWLGAPPTSKWMSILSWSTEKELWITWTRWIRYFSLSSLILVKKLIINFKVIVKYCKIKIRQTRDNATNIRFAQQFITFLPYS